MGYNTHMRKNILSNRETEVLIEITKGSKNHEIGSELGLSPKTIENHVRSILQKLQVKNRTQAVVEGLKRGILNV